MEFILGIIGLACSIYCFASIIIHYKLKAEKDAILNRIVELCQKDKMTFYKQDAVVDACKRYLERVNYDIWRNDFRYSQDVDLYLVAEWLYHEITKNDTKIWYQYYEYRDALWKARKPYLIWGFILFGIPIIIFFVLCFIN